MLTSPGLAIAAVLVIIYFLLNFWSVKLFAHSNAAITVFKLVVPAATGLALIASGFHSENFGVHLEGDPHTIDFAAVLNAVATAGIVFSFNGFQSPVNLAGEARNPSRSIPIAVLGSIGLAAVVYVILQIAYLGAIPPELLAKSGWHGIDFRSPFAELALLVNLNWLAMLLYADAFVSPSGTGITYTATTARMLYGMQRNGTLPGSLRDVAPALGHSTQRDVLQSAGQLCVSVLFSRLGHVGRRDFGRDHHLLPDRTDQRDDAATDRSPHAAPVSCPRSAYRLGGGLHLLDRAAVLGEVATQRGDHSAGRRRAAGLLLLPVAQSLGRLQPALAGGVVGHRLPAGDRRRLLGRKRQVRRPELSDVGLGPRRRRCAGADLFPVGCPVGLEHPRRAAGTPGARAALVYWQKSPTAQMGQRFCGHQLRFRRLRAPGKKHGFCRLRCHPPGRRRCEDALMLQASARRLPFAPGRRRRAELAPERAAEGGVRLVSDVLSDARQRSVASTQEIGG